MTSARNSFVYVFYTTNKSNYEKKFCGAYKCIWYFYIFPLVFELPWYPVKFPELFLTVLVCSFIGIYHFQHIFILVHNTKDVLHTTQSNKKRISLTELNEFDIIHTAAENDFTFKFIGRFLVVRSIRINCNPLSARSVQASRNISLWT